MHTAIVALRVLHIVLGVYWAGTIFFFVTYLEPSIRATGPDGGKVMMQMFARRYLTVLPLAAAGNVLAGIALMWILSDGFAPTWMGSRLGIVLSTGGLFALIAFAIGMGVMRTSAMHIWAIMRSMPQVTDEATRAARMAEAQHHRQRAATSARVVSVLLLLAVAAMAVARYV
jgi:hypothetical protein